MAPKSGNRHRRSVWVFSGLSRPPEPTPSDGPDPYGNPDPEWLRIDWREHLRTVELDGARVNYVERGEGPPLVMVHGLGGCWQNWLENIPHFSRSHRVVALDLPGFGASPMPDWEITIPAYGRLLHDFCEQLGLEPCALVGNSMGGFIATEATIVSPDIVDRLVLVSATGISSTRLRKEPTEALARMAAATTPLIFRVQDQSLRRPRLRWAAVRGVFHAPHRLRPELIWEVYRPAMGAPGFLPAVRALVGYDFTDRLEEVDNPTLIVWGRNDRIVPPKDAYAYAKHLRNSRVVIFDQTGHCAMLERPTRFNRLLDDFLSGDAEVTRETAEDAPKAGRAPEADTVR